MKHTNPIYWTKCFVISFTDKRLRKVITRKMMIRVYLINLLYLHRLRDIRDIRYKKETMKFKKKYNL